MLKKLIIANVIALLYVFTMLLPLPSFAFVDNSIDLTSDYITLSANPQATSTNKQYSVIMNGVRCGASMTPPYLLAHFETVTDSVQPIWNLGDCINEWSFPPDTALSVVLYEYSLDNYLDWNYGLTPDESNSMPPVTWGCSDVTATNYNPSVNAT